MDTRVEELAKIIQEEAEKNMELLRASENHFNSKFNTWYEIRTSAEHILSSLKDYRQRNKHLY